MENLLGSILLLPYNFVPVGFMACNGAHLPITQYSALFSLLGTSYGGNGTTDFALPKLTAPAPGLEYVIAIEGIYPSRQ